VWNHHLPLTDEELAAIIAKKAIGFSPPHPVRFFAALLCGDGGIHHLTTVRTYPYRWIGTFMISVFTYIFSHFIPLSIFNA
jgi:hypothetical protein